MRNTSKYWVQPDKVVLLKTRIVEHLPHLASGPGGHQRTFAQNSQGCASSARSFGGQLRWCKKEQLIRQLNKVKDSEGWWRAVRKQQSSKIYQHFSKFQMWLFWVLFLETRERPLTRCKTSRPPRHLIFGASQSVACQHDVGRCWEIFWRHSKHQGSWVAYGRFIVLHPQAIAICTECIWVLSKFQILSGLGISVCPTGSGVDC